MDLRTTITKTLSGEQIDLYEDVIELSEELESLDEKWLATKIHAYAKAHSIAHSGDYDYDHITKKHMKKVADKIKSKIPTKFHPHADHAAEIEAHGARHGHVGGFDSLELIAHHNEKNPTKVMKSGPRKGKISPKDIERMKNQRDPAYSKHPKVNLPK